MGPLTNVFGGGGGTKTDIIQAAQPTRTDNPTIKSAVDPNQDQAVAEARRARLALARAAGRQSLKVSLNTPSGSTRSGISIA